MRITSWLVLLLPLAACTPLEPLDSGSNDNTTDTGVDTTDTSVDTTDTSVDTTDTGTTDTGTTDTGTTDTGTTDTGTTGTDTGTTDTGGDIGDTAATSDPCTFTLPPHPIVGNYDVVVTQPNQVVWLCKSHNVSVSATATGTVIFLERSGDAVINSKDVVVYMKGSSRLALFQAPNDIWLQDTNDVNDQSGGVNQYTLCPNVVFDYSQLDTGLDTSGCP